MWLEFPNCHTKTFLRKWPTKPVIFNSFKKCQNFEDFLAFCLKNNFLFFRFSFRNDSVASLEFLFERQTGFFLLQIYTPLTLIVICSWVAFWIPGFKAGEVAGRWWLIGYVSKNTHCLFSFEIGDVFHVLSNCNKGILFVFKQVCFSPQTLTVIKVCVHHQFLHN